MRAAFSVFEIVIIMPFFFIIIIIPFLDVEAGAITGDDTAKGAETGEANGTWQSRRARLNHVQLGSETGAKAGVGEGANTEMGAETGLKGPVPGEH